MLQETRPSIISVSKTKKCYHTSINYQIEEVEGGFDVESAIVVTDRPICEEDYGIIVTAIIRAKYSADDVEAIQLNYMETKTTEHKNQFASLKEWRKVAKEKAREVLDYVASVNGE